MPRECMMNSVYEDKGVKTLLSSDQSWAQLLQERMLELRVARHAMGASVPSAEPMREYDEKEEEGEGIEEDKRRGSSSTNNLAPGQPAPQWAMSTVPEFWAMGPTIRVARLGLPTSSRAWGKAPTVQAAPLPPEMDEELEQQL